MSFIDVSKKPDYVIISRSKLSKICLLEVVIITFDDVECLTKSYYLRNEQFLQFIKEHGSIHFVNLQSLFGGLFFKHYLFRQIISFTLGHRFKNGAKLMTKRKLPLLHASNKSSEEPIGKTEAITSSDTGNAQGPPFLTILAGIVVFALLLWVVGSLVSWVFGLFGLIFSK